MQSHHHAFVQSAIEAFGLKGPIYEFDFRPSNNREARSSEQAALSELVQPAAQLYEDVEIDRLEQIESLPFPDRSARTVLCIDALNYCSDPQQSTNELLRILSPGGVVLIAAAAERRRLVGSRLPQQFSPYQFQRLLGQLEASMVGWQGEEQMPHTVYAIGCKPPVPESFVRGVSPFLDRFELRLQELGRSIGLRKRLLRLLVAWLQPPAVRRRRRDFYKMHFVVDLPLGRQLHHQLLQDAAPGATKGNRLDLSN